METTWTHGKLVLRGDRDKCGNRHADTIDQGDDSTALVVQECESPWAAQQYAARMERTVQS